jgi:hypothetical protein
VSIVPIGETPPTPSCTIVTTWVPDKVLANFNTTSTELGTRDLEKRASRTPGWLGQTGGLFRLQATCNGAIVALSFVFDKFYLIMD